MIRFQRSKRMTKTHSFSKKLDLTLQTEEFVFKSKQGTFLFIFFCLEDHETKINRYQSDVMNACIINDNIANKVPHDATLNMCGQNRYQPFWVDHNSQYPMCRNLPDKSDTVRRPGF